MKGGLISFTGQINSNLGHSLWLGNIVSGSGNINSYINNFKNPTPFFIPLHYGTGGSVNNSGKLSISQGILTYALPVRYQVRAGSSDYRCVTGKLGVIDASRYALFKVGNTGSDAVIEYCMENCVVAFTGATFVSGSCNPTVANGYIPQPYPNNADSFVIPKLLLAGTSCDDGYIVLNYSVYKNG